MMTKFLIGAAAIAIAAPLFAQGMQPPAVQTPRMDMPAYDGQSNDRVQTRAEVVAKTQKHFAMLDKNHDGAIAGDEMQMRGGGHGGSRNQDRMERRDGPMGNPGAMFDRLDSNRDGMISRDEFAKGREVRIERQVVINGGPGADGPDGDGDGPSGDRRMMKMHGGGKGGMGGGMMKMADTNNDGRITLQEMTVAALQRFDRTDTNRDGRVTADERKAMHQQMMQQRGQRGS